MSAVKMVLMNEATAQTNWIQNVKSQFKFKRDLSVFIDHLSLICWE